jgi:uncharacterized protein
MKYAVGKATSFPERSAHAAITMGIYSAVTGAELRRDVFITGTINSEGKVGPIGGVQYKGIAVAENNGSLFLVRLGQSSLTIYREVTRNMGGMSFTFYEPVDVDLEDYLDELGYNVEVVEVSDIDDVITYYHSP